MGSFETKVDRSSIVPRRGFTDGPGGGSRVGPGASEASRGVPGRVPGGSREAPGGVPGGVPEGFRGGPGRLGGPRSAQGGHQEDLETKLRVRGRFGVDWGANLGAFGGSPGANLGPFFEHRFRYAFRKPPGSVSEPFPAPKMDPKRHPKGPRRSPEREVQIRQKYAKTLGFLQFFAFQTFQR